MIPGQGVIAMKTRWKRTAYTLAAVAGMLLLLRLVLGLLIPGDRTHRLAVDRVVEATGAEVTLGEASVRLWPTIAITMGQGRIQGTGPALAEKTGSDNTLESFAVSVGRLVANLKIGPLLRGRIEVGKVNLSCPELQVVAQEGTIRMEGLEVELSDFFLPVAAVGKDLPAGKAGSGAPGEAIPEELSLVFSASLDRLVWQDAPYDEVEVEGELDGRVLRADSFSARRSSGLVTGSLELDYQRDPWGILEFAAVVTAAPAVDFLEPWAPELASRLDCDLSGEVSGGCELKDSDSVNRTLDLTGRLGSGQGVLRAGDWLEDITSYLGERQDLKDIRFSELDHSFRVSQGRYLVEELTIDGLDTDWSGEGWVDLGGDIDLDLHVKLPVGFTPDLGQWSWLADGLRDEEQRVNLTLHLSGQAARPRVGLKLGGGGSSGENNPTEALKTGLGGFLDKLKTR